MAATAVHGDALTASLPGQVTDAIAEVLPSNDPLDRADFNPIDYINSQFPTEVTMDRLEPFVERVNGQISTLDEEISRAVQAQAEAGERAARDISEAKNAIHELHTKIKDIKGKAEASEEMVQEICRDIKQLDFAKRHLQTTITALKRLHMLQTAVEQLKLMAEGRHYKEASHLLDAVSQLLTHFEPYANIPKIADLRSTVDTIKQDLTDEILDAFNRVTDLASSSADPDSFVDTSASSGSGDFASLGEACLVVDALGPKATKRQIAAIIKEHLAEYQRLPDFQKGGDSASLDQIDRRFAWFRRLLRGVETKYNDVFPAHWKIAHRLVLEFLSQTKSQLLEVLGSGDPEMENVTILLKALQKSIMFEKDMQLQFEGDDGANGLARPDLDEDGNSIDPRSAMGIKRKYEREKLLAQKSQSDAAVAASRSLSNGLGSSSSASAKGLDDEPLPSIIGMLSSVFDPFMGPYIALERKNMDDMVRKVIAEEQVEEGGALPVYTSSVQIFAYIKNSIKRCTALTSGQTFFNLHKEFKACLANYVEILRQKMTTAAGGSKVLPEGAEKDICYVVNTAEYCSDTVPQLEEMVKSKIDQPYQDKIELSEEQDMFFDVIAAAIKALVKGLESQVEGSCRTMGNINWGNVEMVGEENAYVRTINVAVLAYVPNCRAVLSSLYFRNFCDKFAAAFIPAFLNLVLKQKRISEEGTQQLLLDVYNLKKMMLDLPRIGQAEGEAEISVPMSYRKYVEKHMTKIEKVLKLVGTPAVMLVERFRIMWMDGGMKELQMVMSLKGMKKQEQQTILETFGGGVATTAAAAPASSASSSRAAAGAGGGGGGLKGSTEKASAGLEKAGAAMGSGVNQAAAMSKKAAAGMKGAMGDLSKAFR